MMGTQPFKDWLEEGVRAPIGFKPWGKLPSFLKKTIPVVGPIVTLFSLQQAAQAATDVTSNDVNRKTQGFKSLNNIFNPWSIFPVFEWWIDDVRELTCGPTSPGLINWQVPGSTNSPLFQ
jgi:hypothetical protein